MQDTCCKCGLVALDEDQFCRNCGQRIKNDVFDSVPVFPEGSVYAASDYFVEFSNNKKSKLIFIACFSVVVFSIVVFVRLSWVNIENKAKRDGIVMQGPLERGLDRQIASKDPIDSAINSLLQQKGMGNLSGGSSAPSTSGSGGTAPRVASAQEIAEAQQAIQRGQQFASQGQWKEAADQFYIARERAINTDTGDQAARLYNDAQKHTGLFGGTIPGGDQ